MRLAWTMMLALAACGPQSPEQARIENIEDAADNEMHAIRAEIGNEVGNMHAQAEALTNEAQAKAGYEAERLKTRAEALTKEAQIVQRQGDAQIRAVKDRARAETSAIRAQ